MESIFPQNSSKFWVIGLKGFMSIFLGQNDYWKPNPHVEELDNEFVYKKSADLMNF